MDEAAFVAEGLYDPQAPGAEDRLALLDYLRARGATIEDLRDAPDLAALAGELARRRSDARLTPLQAAERTGVDIEIVERVVRSAGLPTFDRDLPVFREADLAAFPVLIAGVDAFGQEPALEFTRTIGAAVAAIADSAMALFGINVAGRFGERNLGELERARVYEAASGLLTGQVPLIIDLLFSLHIETAARRSIDARTDDTRTATFAVGFVDLVASTALNRGLGPADLADAIGGFERDATELVGTRGGRVVKMIGDEVMFVNADPIAACRTALELRSAVMANTRLGSVRGGMAFGDLVLGYGDFYGEQVNLAARLVEVAEPGQILVSAPLGERALASPDFEVCVVDDVVVRGFDESVGASTLDYRLDPGPGT